MILVLAGIALASGISLGGLNMLTYERAQNNILKYKKIPAVVSIWEIVEGRLDEKRKEAVERELLAERKYLDLGEEDPRLFFVIHKGGRPFAVALEDFGPGFGGDLGVMAGFELETGNLVGIDITTLSETPGVGTRVTEESFTLQFRGMSKDTDFRIKKDGGGIDALSGATISCRAVAHGIDRASAFYQKNVEKIRASVYE